MNFSNFLPHGFFLQCKEEILWVQDAFINTYTQFERVYARCSWKRWGKMRPLWDLEENSLERNWKPMIRSMYSESKLAHFLTIYPGDMATSLKLEHQARMVHVWASQPCLWFSHPHMCHGSSRAIKTYTKLWKCDKEILNND